jgi:hypothetical protein
MVQGLDLEKFDFNDFWIPQLGHGTGSEPFIDFVSLEQIVLKEFLIGRSCIDIEHSTKF